MGGGWDVSIDVANSAPISGGMSVPDAEAGVDSETALNCDSPFRTGNVYISRFSRNFIDQGTKRRLRRQSTG